MQVYWYNEPKTIVYWVIDAQWAWDDFHAARREGNTMIRSQEQIVHCFIDMHQNRVMPDNIASNIQIAVDEIPQNNGLIVVIGTGLLTQTLFSVVRRVFFPNNALINKFYLTASVEQALKLVDSYSPPSA